VYCSVNAYKAFINTTNISLGIHDAFKTHEHMIRIIETASYAPVVMNNAAERRALS